MSETRVPPAPMTGAYAALVKAVIRKKLGSVPAGVQVMWHHRDVLGDTMKFGRRSEKWDRLDHIEVTDEMAAALLADLGPDGLLELTTRVGLMNMTARGNIALGIRSEHYAEACGLPPMAVRPDVASAS